MEHRSGSASGPGFTVRGEGMDERSRFESEEIAGLARQHGAKRVEVEPGVFAWQFPPWLCPHCTPIGGPDTMPLEGCPSPLARHGKVNDGR